MGYFQNGYIKLYRKAVFGDIGKSGNCLLLWVHLLARANRFPSTARLDGKPVDLPAGSVLVGLRQLSVDAHVSYSSLRRHLKYLQERHTISLTSGSEGTIITIRNWKKYNDEEEEGGSRANARNESRAAQERLTTGSPPVPLMENIRIEEESDPSKIFGAIPALCGVIGEELLKDVSHQGQFTWVDRFGVGLMRRELPKALSYWETHSTRRWKGNPGNFLRNWFENAEKFEAKEKKAEPVRRHYTFKEPQ
jgi:hypothetical protein